jgi:metal-dependent HD superfamily phosphatase/phosphodiesterase
MVLAKSYHFSSSGGIFYSSSHGHTQHRECHQLHSANVSPSVLERIVQPSLEAGVSFLRGLALVLAHLCVAP